MPLISPPLVLVPLRDVVTAQHPIFVGRCTFHPITERTADLVARLEEQEFTEITVNGVKR